MLDSIFNAIANDPTYTKITLVLVGLISVVISIKLFKKLFKMVIIFLVLGVMMMTGFFLISKENPVDKIKQFIADGKATVSTVKQAKTEFSKGMDFLEEFNEKNQLPDGAEKKTLTQKRVEELLKKYEKK